MKVLHLKKLFNKVIAITLCFALLLTGQLTSLRVFAADTDVIITSDKYIVNEVSGTISDVPYEDSAVNTFISNLKMPPQSTYVLAGDIENDQKGEIRGGKIVTGNEITITSANGSVKRTYKIEIKQQFNAENQFSSLQGANNWFYKEIHGGDLKDMVWGRPGALFDTWTGTPQFSVAWKNMVHPDVGSQPVRIFKAPKNGKIAIDNNIQRITPNGNGVRAKVMRNNEKVWPQNGEWAPVDTTLITSSSQIDVSKGDEIKFILDNSGMGAPNTTYWRMVVTYLPYVQVPTGIEVSGDSYICIPSEGTVNTKYKATVVDQNNEAIVTGGLGLQLAE